MIDVTKKEGKTFITLDNGHASGLEKIAKDYDLKGEKEALIFMLSVISEAEGKDINNGKGSFAPSDSLKNPAK